MAVEVVVLIIYVLIFVIAMFANCIFIGVVNRSKDLHTPVFLILSNECVSDLLFLLATTFFASDFISGKGQSKFKTLLPTLFLPILSKFGLNYFLKYLSINVSPGLHVQNKGLKVHNHMFFKIFVLHY